MLPPDRTAPSTQRSAHGLSEQLARATKLLRAALGGKMDIQHQLTEQSIRYRQRASDLARRSDTMADPSEQLDLIQQALRWITMAENDEMLGQMDE